MKYIPILFSTAMVQALLAGRKTMTRRVNNLDLINKEPDKYHITNANYVKNGALMQKFFYGNECYVIKCPYGKVGDVLWVRENYKLYINYDNQVYVGFEGRETFDVYNKKDISLSTLEKIVARKLKPNEWHSCPSIHLYKEFASIFLKITDIKVERLQDISEEDAMDEGVELHERGVKWLNYLDKRSTLTQFIFNCYNAKESFRTLWQMINGHMAWHANPWVWVIKFEQIEKPEDFK
jgi:hypothetical protein